MIRKSSFQRSSDFISVYQDETGKLYFARSGQRTSISPAIGDNSQYRKDYREYIYVLKQCGWTEVKSHYVDPSGARRENK